MRINHTAKMERDEMRMVRLMYGTSLSDRLSSAELRRRVGVEAIRDVIRRSRLRWFEHVEWKDNTEWVKGCTYKAAGRGDCSCWQNSVSADLSLLGTTTVPWGMHGTVSSGGEPIANPAMFGKPRLKMMMIISM